MVMRWSLELLQRFTNYPKPAVWAMCFGLWMVQALPWAWFAGTVWWLTQRRQWSWMVSVPVVWVASEFLIPRVFPWSLSVSQLPWLSLVQVVDITGIWGVTAWLGVVNALVAEVMFARSMLWGRSIGVALLSLVMVGYGKWQIAHRESVLAKQERIAIGIVQPNLSYDSLGVANPSFSEKQLNAWQSLSHELEDKGAKIVIWTELSYPHLIYRTRKGDFGGGDPRRIRRNFGVPLVFGAESVARHGGQVSRWNSMFFMNENGTFQERYDKRHLLFLGEQTAIRDWIPGLSKWFPATASQYQTGKEEVTFRWSWKGKEMRLSPLICFEDVFPERSVEISDSKPHLLVNITNDSWFGSHPEPQQHLALSAFRAIELRVPMIRAVNPGASALILPTGRIAYQTPVRDVRMRSVVPEGVVWPVPMIQPEKTMFARSHQAFAWILSGFSLVALIWKRKRHTKD
jgi:apolipoprotein N-acyltransferase